MFLTIGRIANHNHCILHVLEETFQYFHYCCCNSSINGMWPSVFRLNIKCIRARELWIIYEHWVKIHMVSYPISINEEIAEFLYFFYIIGEWQVGIHIAQ